MTSRTYIRGLTPTLRHLRTPNADPNPTLASLGEFGWLARLVPRLPWPTSSRRRLVVGPGDDAGVLKWPSGRCLVATCDALVEGVHFQRAWMPWEALGHKALAVNLSDCAAMGAVTPLAALVSLALPGDIPVDDVDKFYQGMNKLARETKVGILGGDTVGSARDVMVSVCVIGAAEPGQLLTRAGATPGDLLWVTGFLGDAGAALEVLTQRSTRRRLRRLGRAPHAWAPLVRKQWYPQPRLAEGRLLAHRRLATSLMDCSDGLEPSLRLLCRASRVGAEVELKRIPLSTTLRRWARHRGTAPWDYALVGGEDYELVFTTRPAVTRQVQRWLPTARPIGRILPPRAGVWARMDGRAMPLDRWGYAHFPPR